MAFQAVAMASAGARRRPRRQRHGAGPFAMGTWREANERRPPPAQSADHQAAAMSGRNADWAQGSGPTGPGSACSQINAA